MLFSELYSAYYNTVAAVLRAAVKKPLDAKKLRGIIERHAFGESGLVIEPALTGEKWQLLRPDGSTPIKHVPTMPLTTLQKRWLKAIYADPRIRLFTDEVPELSDVEPLFTPEDFYVYDRYADGDPYEDENYIRHFRLVLAALKERFPLQISAVSARGSVSRKVFMPDYLEYSEKDDKFRVIGAGYQYGGTINLGRIIACEPYTEKVRESRVKKRRAETGTVVFELRDERNALERALLHFAHFRKEVERQEENTYKVTVSYDRDDETEMVIRILSFGPMVKVISPGHFVDLIKDRLMRQKSCGQ